MEREKDGEIICTVMSMIKGRTQQILLAIILVILLWPLLMVVLGVRYRNECPGEPHLAIYHIVYGSLWIFLFLINLGRCHLLFRYWDVLSLVIWLLLLVLTIPGYVYMFDLRETIRIDEEYPAELCEKSFYVISWISIILVHIPLYIFLWLLWLFTHPNTEQPRVSRVFAIAPI